MNFPFKKQIPQNYPPRRIQNDEGCKIKIKTTKTGREITFHGNCSKEQISVARERLGLERDEITTED